MSISVLSTEKSTDRFFFRSWAVCARPQDIVSHLLGKNQRKMTKKEKSLAHHSGL
jgi:hypothetical protein